LFAKGSTENRISAREFETYRGHVRVLTEWVSAVLSSFLDPPPARLEALERKYSSTREADHMMMQYNIPKALCNKLYRMFCNLCKTNGRPEMELVTWLELTRKYIHPNLAFEIFRSKLHDVKVAWRFLDFFEFCYIFGLFIPSMTDAEMDVGASATLSTVERQAAALCTIFQLAAERESERDMVQVEEVNIDDTLSEFGVNIENYSPSNEEAKVKSKHYMRRLVYLLSTPSIPSEKTNCIQMSSISVSSNASDISTICSLSQDEIRVVDSSANSNQDKYVAPAVWRALLELENSSIKGPTLKEYVGFLCGFQTMLPGFKSLSMLACCGFGVRPLFPELEKLFIMDLILRRQDEAPQTKQCPSGPLGTEWCVVSSSWLNAWRFYVGQKRRTGGAINELAIKVFYLIYARNHSN
jgi:hypothetical protein